MCGSGALVTSFQQKKKEGSGKINRILINDDQMYVRYGICKRRDWRRDL